MTTATRATLPDELSALREVIRTPLGAPAGAVLYSSPTDLHEAVLALRALVAAWTKKRRRDVVIELVAALAWTQRAAEIDGEKYPDYQALVLRTGRQYAEYADTVRCVPARYRTPPSLARPNRVTHPSPQPRPTIPAARRATAGERRPPVAAQ